jgi:GNAT superfamily N-acetyltransferase
MPTSPRTTATIRPMQPADLEFATACTLAEGWHSETRFEFEGYYQHAPGGCLLAEVGDQRVGICIATSYGWAGFIGELIVLKEWRGQGIGRALLQAAIAYLHRQGAHSIYLDGVASAVPFYERMGFRKICRSLRFGGIIQGQAHLGARRMCPADLDAVARLDQQVFGADRRFFLARRLAQLPEHAIVLPDGESVAGFLLCRPVANGFSVGPWIAREDVPRPLDLLEALATPFGSLDIGLGVLESNAAAVQTIRGLGLDERPTPPWRMVLGPSDRLGLSPAAWANGSAAKG